MLKDVIAFVKSRTGLTDRATILREINFAWSEIWNSDDLPGSVQEITLKSAAARISLPWYVGETRGCKIADGVKVTLNTPRPHFQSATLWQTELKWRIFGPQPLYASILNASTLDVVIEDAEIENLTVVLIGPDDTAQDRREELVFTPGIKQKTSRYRFTDLTAFAKDIITISDVRLYDSTDTEISTIPNTLFEASNLFVQIKDHCDSSVETCYDVLYKKKTPYLYYDESPVPFQEVLMAKTLEWISLPKDEQISKTQAFSQKATNLLTQFNFNEKAVSKVLDIERNLYTTNYNGYI